MSIFFVTDIKATFPQRKLMMQEDDDNDYTFTGYVSSLENSTAASSALGLMQHSKSTVAAGNGTNI